MSQMTFDQKSDRHNIITDLDPDKYKDRQSHSMSDQTLITPSSRGGRNAGIYLSNEFISKIDSARGDVRRSTFVMRAIEHRLEELNRQLQNNNKK